MIIDPAVRTALGGAEGGAGTGGGPVLLVTGAASGIGRATVLAAAAAGYAVGVGTFAGDPYDAAAVVAEVVAGGSSALALDAGVRDTAAMTAAVVLPAGGSVVLVSSIAGAALGWVGHTPYAAAKAGLIGFLRSAALELDPRGVRVNAVLPGVIESPQSLDPVSSGGPDGLVESARAIPLGRVGQPGDVADVITFLLSDAARYVTAQTLTVDGGLTSVWPG